MNKNRILIVNGDRLSRRSLFELLCRRGFSVDVVDFAKEAISKIEHMVYDAVIMDSHNIASEEFLNAIKTISPKSKTLVLTSYGNIEFAVNSIKMGAVDYLVKPVEDEKILTSIENAVSSSRDIEKTKRSLREESFYGLVGSSHSMKDIYAIIDKIANSRATVLLCGESGTGKRLIAHALHKADKKRRSKPFIEISCGGLPREIIESELFGHTKGAFTGAINDRKGRFELADGGTILLDDIDCLPLDLQVKLLRVLQHKEFERVGDSKTMKVDVRIIASTNQDLDKAIAEKKLREDLYYRLNVISIHVPPLRERREDILNLAEHFVNLYAKDNHKQIKGIEENVARVLKNYNWPGNVRQLENIIERAVILDVDNIIGGEDLPEIIFGTSSYEVTVVNKEAVTNGSSLKDILQEPERVHILRTLEEVGWNKKKAANKLGVNRTTLYNKLRKYNITVNQ